MWENIKNYIKVEDLKDRYLYHIYARNANIGIWLKEKNSFLISRFKFESNFLFEEFHWDVCKHFGTVKPLKEIEKCPFENAGKLRDWDDTKRESEMMQDMVNKKEINSFKVCIYMNELIILNYLNKKEREIYKEDET